jgi:hypothetical protein
MNETRVNLKHLLEDIRDSYPLRIEEVIIVELVANSLDSGAAKINISINALDQSITVIDDGRGMRRTALKEYHNIAASTKVRGGGIGFAGIGAKLSLLIANSVITETKGGQNSHAATTWHLASDTRAPWQFIPSANVIQTPHGTAVKIILADPNSELLAPDFVRQTIINHFQPLLSQHFFEIIYRHIYKKGVEFSANKVKIDSTQFLLPKDAHTFRIILGRKLVGFGYLARADQNETASQGLVISTYGKVIKNGWEWLGLEAPKNHLFGIVEVPTLAQILTINKMDFLRDVKSLKIYYRLRKAIQSAVLPILPELGSESMVSDPAKTLRPLTRQIEQALRRMIGNFPELLPLLGVRSTKNPALALKAIGQQPLVKIDESNSLPRETEKSPVKSTKKETGQEKSTRRKTTALAIGYEAGTKKEPIARMIESRILINTSHPAYLKAQKQRLESYHNIFCVGWALSHYLEDDRSPQAFINDFLASWGDQDLNNQPLF